MKKNWFGALLILLHLFWAGTLFAFDPKTEEIKDKLSTLRSREANPLLKNDKKEILTAFCTKALENETSKGFNWEKDRYSSQQSLFLYVLCGLTHTSPLTSFSPYLGTGEWGYLKDISLQKLNYPKSCNKESKEKCNLAELSTTLIQDILWELIILKHANSYGITHANFTSKKEIDEAINRYAIEKLKIGSKENPFCNGKKHSYPQTCKVIRNNIKGFQKAFNKLKIIDAKKLLTLPEEWETKVKKHCNKNPHTPESYDHTFCSIFWVTHMGLRPFITRIYNELLRYQLFTSYYQEHLRIQNTENTELQQEIRHLQLFTPQLLQITNQTLQQLADLHNSYPIHIGLLSYQEDLLWLRDQYLSKLVSPFYSLFYKLQNVQIQS